MSTHRHGVAPAAVGSPEGTILNVTPDNDPFFPDGIPAQLPEPASSGAVARISKRPSSMVVVPDAMALARALRRHWVLAVSLGLLGASITGNLAWRLFPKPKYTAATLLEVKTQKPILLLETSQEKTDFKIFQSTQLALIKSKLVLKAALRGPESLICQRFRARPTRSSGSRKTFSSSFPPARSSSE